MLDPQRIGLNAASVGFLKRTGQNVDWASFNQALQTDDSRVADVRATVETPVDELHVMGGQRFGLEGNSNLKMNARQERQINGYPLRSFSANAPAIILPDKYGGLPMYTRNQTEYSDFVSRYTAPLSTALQNDTVLLGRQGYSVTNESASHPYRDVGFEHNLHKSKDAIDYNEAMIKQRQWLQYQSHVAQKQKRGGKVTEMRMSSVNGRGVKNAVDGIFISANGEPMTQVNSDSLGNMANEAYIATPAPALDRLLPGPGGAVDPSSDDLVEYNPFKAASQTIANEIIHRSNQVKMLRSRDNAMLQDGFAQARYATRRSIDARRTPVRGAPLNQLDLGGSGSSTATTVPDSFAYNLNTVEGMANSRILASANRTLFTPSPGSGLSNQEIVIDENPLASQAQVLSSLSYIPNGSQAMSLIERMSAAIDRAEVIAGRGSLGEPDLIIARPQQEMPRRNKRRESMTRRGSSNRNNEVLGFTVRDARSRRGGTGIDSSSFLTPRKTISARDIRNNKSESRSLRAAVSTTPAGAVRMLKSRTK